MKKKILLPALMLAALGRLHGQTSINMPTSFYIALADTTIITGINSAGTPYFSVSGINSLVSQYGITGFQKAYPSSRFKTLRQVYEFTCNNAGAPVALKTAFPAYFGKSSPHAQGATLADYYPNDMPLTAQQEMYPIHPAYLRYINAPTAWGIDTGNANTIIGITDSYVNVFHEDLFQKFVSISKNTDSTGGEAGHGTQVCGYAAAATNNGKGYPAIGFACKMDFAGEMDITAMHAQSIERGRKILNASWYYPWYGPDTVLNLEHDINDEIALQEIYENGTIAFIAAGNTGNDTAGHANGSSFTYQYPSSLDYSFSVSDVGWEHAYTDTFHHNVAGVHEQTIGDTLNTYRHNSRVDLLAPGLEVGGLTYQPNNAYSWNLSGGGGTSYSTPMVAGTAGLILTENPCYSPYQVEYVLKQSANSGVLQLPENQKFAGRLGAGALDAGKALQMADHSTIQNTNVTKLNCNDAATQTFWIEGVKITSLCSPNAGTGSRPKLTPVLVNGTPPYTYRWEYNDFNAVVLSSRTAAEPEIDSATGDSVNLRLTVYDNSPVQKVASKLFHMKLYTDPNKYDLAMRDSYMDMMDEPNTMMKQDPRDWNIWQSPDIWNRLAQDGIEEHQDPEYSVMGPNYLYVRVHNVGCAASPANAYLRLYWTKSSTGENWKNNWDGSLTVAGSDPAQPYVPASGELLDLTNPSGPGPAVIFHSVAPGADSIFNSPWYVQDPKSYFGSPSTIEACVLARIEIPNEQPNFGIHIPEVFGDNVKINVLSNNNIITKNLVINNLVPGKPVRRGVDFANAGEEPRFFDLQLINDRSINAHFSGDFSAVGYATLYLGDLYERWIEGGAQGSYATADGEAKTVTFDGSTPLRLNNILLNPEERFPVGVAFTQRDGVPTYDFNYTFHLRQFDRETPDEVYGNITFKITTKASQPAKNKAATQQVAGVATGTNILFSIYPNPADNQLNIINLTDAKPVCNITIADLLGRKLISKEKVSISNTPQPVDISRLSPGIYMVTIIAGDGTHDQFKFVKK